MKRPKTVFRYQSFSARTLDSLCRDTLHFAAPTDFNDPLDCSPVIETDSDTETLRSLLRELVSRRVESEVVASLEEAKLKGAGAQSHAKKKALQAAEYEISNIAYNATNPDYDIGLERAEVMLLTAGIEKELLRHYAKGVCCFSSEMYNPLLWSHYADQHRGFCVGYGFDREPKPIVLKVVYGGSRSIPSSLVASALLEESVDAKVHLDRDVLLRKAPQWKYEKEWRLLGARGVHDSPLKLEEVTFGLRCALSIQHTVIASLAGRDNDVSFYEMYEDRSSFRLSRRAVDLDELRVSLPHSARSSNEMFEPYNKSDSDID
ncbi:DUF2971 domain-containing protein [uncultured Nitrosomonas sp.]|uniref:DUF2971 domain-containing protein n=1 Tax=uncultured Nitrosomonas sp. TaxID=156424 RepID=UPI0025CBE00A|nr:DUF2971 domain-containing protein [uncultured Nitrosomonas sp.]